MFSIQILLITNRYERYMCMYIQTQFIKTFKFLKKKFKVKSEIYNSEYSQYKVVGPDQTNQAEDQINEKSLM